MGSVEPLKFSVAGEINGKVDLKWVAIGDAGLQIDIDQAALPAAALLGMPFTGIGLKGAIDLGKKGSRAQLHAAAKILLLLLNYDIGHVLREKNTDADAMANQGVDTKKRIPESLLMKLHDHGISL